MGMGKNPVLFAVVILTLLLLGCSSSSSSSSSTAPPAAKIAGTVVTNVVSLFKLLWSLKSTTPTPKPAVPNRSTMKFESGYTVETIFDGSKVGIEPFSVEVSQAGEVLILDYQNSNIYKTSSPLSHNSRPKLVVGSPEGYTGHVDGKLREAKMNHPKGFAVDDAGNVYVADTMNLAIRKITDSGVVTIAGGGKWARGGAHVDGPSEDAKFSNDFDLVYVGRSCSLLVIDRGNQAIREIQLHQHDCSDHHYRHRRRPHHREDEDDEANLHHLGTALLVTAVFLGYMIALVQRRMAALFSSHRDRETPTRGILPPPSQYQLNAKPIRPPLIPPPPPEDDTEYEKSDENLLVSIGRLFAAAAASVFEIFGGLFLRSRPNRKSQPQQQHHPHHHHRRLQHYPSYNPNYDNPPIARPLQESYVIPREEEPPHLEPVDPTPRNSYSHTPPKDVERARHFKQSRPNATYSGWTSDPRQQQQHYQQQQQQQQQQFQQLHRHQKQRAPSPQTYIEKSCETKEIVFGAVQEQDGRREAMVIKAVDYSDPAAFNRYNVRSRYNYNATYSHGYN